MKKDELMQVIEILKEYDLINYFSSVDEAEKWLLLLDSKKINNLKKLHDDKIVLNSSLRRVLLNDKLLSSNFYRQLISLFLKDDIEEAELIDLCNKVALNETLLQRLERIIDGMFNHTLGIRLLKDKNFMNSPYLDADLNTIFGARTPEVEECLYELAKSDVSIKGGYHLDDMRIISKSDKETATLLWILAINENSLESESHHTDMLEFTLCPVETQECLYKLMINGKLLQSPNYELLRKSIRESSTKKKAEAKLVLATNMSSIDSKLLEYLLASIDSIHNGDELEFVCLLNNDEFFNSPYFKEDIEILKEAVDFGTFYRLRSLMLNVASIESIHHVEDAKCILEAGSNSRRKSGILYNLATNEANLASTNHRFDMNFVKTMDFDTLTGEELWKIEYYLLDSDGIESPKHIETLYKFIKNIGEEIKTPIDEYFEMLQDKFKNQADREDINILRKK